MRNILTIAALAAGLATAANAATPTTTRHHHAAKTDSGSAAVRELNEKSLQQAEAGTPMAGPMTGQNSPAMSDSGMAAPMASGAGNSSGMAPTPTDATPTAPTTPQ